MWTKKLVRTARNSLLIGLMLIAPVAFTVLIVQYLFRFLLRNQVTEFLAKLLQHLIPGRTPSQLEKGLSSAVALLLIVFGIFLIGFFVRSFVGKRLYSFGDRLLGRIPLINRIYLFVRQVSEALFTQRKSLFKEAVLVEYPRKGLYSLAFVTARMPPDFRERLTVRPGEELVTVFVPTTPNPTSGFLLLVPRSGIIPFPASSAESMTFVLSGGNLYPGAEVQRPRLGLLDMLEHWDADSNPRAKRSGNDETPTPANPPAGAPGAEVPQPRPDPTHGPD